MNNSRWCDGLKFLAIWGGLICLGASFCVVADSQQNQASSGTKSVEIYKDPVDLLLHSVDDSYHEGDPMIAIEQERDVIAALQRHLDADSSNVNINAKLAQAHIRLADAIGPYAMLGDQRLQKLVAHEFDVVSKLLQEHLHDGNHDPYLMYFLARFYTRQASHWLLSGDRAKAAIPFLQGTLFYTALAEKAPDDPTWHRAVGLSYLTIADSYSLGNDDFYQFLRVLNIGEDLLDQYPEADRRQLEKALPFQLAVKSLEKTNELAPVSFQLPCELSLARQRAASALEKLELVDYAAKQAEQINMLFCEVMWHDPELTSASAAVSKIIDALRLNKIIPKTQLEALRALEQRELDHWNLEVSANHYIAFWYGTLGYLALMQPIDFEGALPEDLPDLGLKSLKGAVSLEPENHMLRRYLDYAYRVTGRHDAAIKQANTEANQDTVGLSFDDLPIFYDWNLLREKGIGFLYESAILDILENFGDDKIGLSDKPSKLKP